MRFRKKPVEVEAMQFTRESEGALLAWATRFTPGQDPVEATLSGKLVVHTLEGHMTASVGDWIIRGVRGEFYPCKPEIFDATYEPVVEVGSLPSDYSETAQ